jgi:hypothetical protein
MVFVLQLILCTADRIDLGFLEDLVTQAALSIGEIPTFSLIFPSYKHQSI